MTTESNPKEGIVIIGTERSYTLPYDPGTDMITVPGYPCEFARDSLVPTNRSGTPAIKSIYKMQRFVRTLLVRPTLLGLREVRFYREESLSEEDAFRLLQKYAPDALVTTSVLR